METAAWTPHVSIAYSQVTGSADAYADALAGEDGRVGAFIAAVQLIELGRDHYSYEWTVQSEVHLAPSRT